MKKNLLELLLDPVIETMWLLGKVGSEILLELKQFLQLDYHPFVSFVSKRKQT